MTRHQSEITVCGQELEIVSDRKLRQQRVDGCYLNSSSPAGCLQICGLDVISKIGNDLRQSREMFNEAFSLFWPAESLQQLLNN